MNGSCDRCGQGPDNINAGPGGFVCSMCWSNIVAEHSRDSREHNLAMQDKNYAPKNIRRKIMKKGKVIVSSDCLVGACVGVKLNKNGAKIQNTGKPQITIPFSKKEWMTFIQGVKRGEFDLK